MTISTSRFPSLTVLVKSDENHGALHELLVVEHGVDQVLDILGGEGDVGVVGIVVEVGRVVHVVGSTGAKSNILGKVLLRVDDVLATAGVVADVVERHEGVVLAATPGPFSSKASYGAVGSNLPDIEGLLDLANRVALAIGQGRVTLHVGLPSNACGSSCQQNSKIDWPFCQTK